MGHINGLIGPKESVERFIDYMKEPIIPLRKSDAVLALNTLLMAARKYPEMLEEWTEVAMKMLMVSDVATVENKHGRIHILEKEEQEEQKC